MKFNENVKINFNKSFTASKPQVQNFGKTFQNGSFFQNKILIGGLVIVFVGILSGYMLHASGKGISQKTTSQTGGTDNSQKAASSGNQVFSDSTEGTLEAGSMGGEGTHKLVRLGGESQTVYLTSSFMDLSKYEGKKVRVWGQTFAAKKAGWLMDVGKVEVLE